MAIARGNIKCARCRRTIWKGTAYRRNGAAEKVHEACLSVGLDVDAVTTGRTIAKQPGADGWHDWSG